MSGASRAEALGIVLPARALERWYFVAALSLIAMLPYLLGAQPVGGLSAEAATLFVDEGDPAKQLVLALVYASFGVLVLARLRLATLRSLGTPLIALILLCAASALWSDLPLVALRRSAALAGTATVGLYAGQRFDIDELLELLCRVVAIVVIASFVIAALQPTLGLDGEGRLRGVFAHKNTCGSFAALGLLALAARLARRPSRDSMLFCALCAFACLVALVLSNAASPLPSLVAGFAFMAWIHRSGPRAGGAATVMLAAACILAMAMPLCFDEFSLVALALGRDPDFSHRDLVWRFALELFGRNPWLGYGYEVFWTGPAGELFMRTAGFAVSHAHNGYLELALGTGLFGLTALLCAIGTLVRRGMAVLAAGERAPAVWLIGFTAFYVVASAAESHAWKPNGFLTLLFVYAVVRANLLVKVRHA